MNHIDKVKVKTYNFFNLITLIRKDRFLRMQKSVFFLFRERRKFMHSRLSDFWLRKGDGIEEWFRLKFHTYFTTILIAFNVLLLGTSGLSVWLALSFDFPFLNILPLHTMSWWFFLFLLNVPLLTWFYSTITFPIKKGHKVLIDWAKTEKGRIWSAFLNGGPFIFLMWAAMSRYTHQHYEDSLLKVTVDKEQYGFLLSTSLQPFLTLIYIVPVLLTVFLGIISYRHFLVNEKILKKQFYNWEYPLVTKYSHNLEYGKCDVIVGWDKETTKPIILKEASRYLHEVVVGATGSGKTSTALLLRIVQDLIRVAKGNKTGVVLLEPKGDAVEDVLKLAKELGVPEEKIYVIDPTKTNTTKFNPFYGPLEAAAESFRGTLDSLTGDQDEFFKGQQNETAALYTMLAKLYYGSLTNITHIQQMYSDPRYLANIVESVREQLDTRSDDAELTAEDKKSLAMYERVVRYFEDEVLEYKTFRERDKITDVRYPEGHRYAGRQMVENKKDKFVSGAKQYLNDIATNTLLSDLMVPNEKDKVLDLDDFLSNGGVLLVNTALGELEELSLMLGQFFIRQFQGAVFRRPKGDRCPIFFTIDEFPLYINEAFERFLTLGRSYNVGSLIAIQSLGQLDSVVKGYKETILSNASNKTVFGRGSFADNKIFSDTFGEEEVVEESMNESTTPITVENPSWGLRHNTQKMLAPRFSPTDIKELPFKHMIVELVDEDNSISTPRIATGAFVSEAKFLKKYFKLAKVNLKSEDDQQEDSIVDEFIGHKPVKKTASEQKVTTAAEKEEQTDNDTIVEKVDVVKKSDNEEPLISEEWNEVAVTNETINDTLKEDEEETLLDWSSVVLSGTDSVKEKKTTKKATNDNATQMTLFDLPSEEADILPFYTFPEDQDMPPLTPLEQHEILEDVPFEQNEWLSEQISNENEKIEHSIPDDEMLEQVNLLVTEFQQNDSQEEVTAEVERKSRPSGVMEITDTVVDDL